MISVEWLLIPSSIDKYNVAKIKQKVDNCKPSNII